MVILMRDDEAKLPPGFVRAYELKNGDIIEVWGVLVEFKDGMFYEVKEVMDSVKSRFERVYEYTSKVFTVEELNRLSKKKKVMIDKVKRFKN